MKVNNEKGDLTNIYVCEDAVLTLEYSGNNKWFIELEVYGDTLTFSTSIENILVMLQKIHRFIDVEKGDE